MPLRGGRVGAGSRGGRISVRAPRVRSGSSGGFKGFRFPMSRSTSPAVSTPSAGANTTPPNTLHHRPLMRPGGFRPLGTIWKILAIIIALFVFSGCACVGLGFLLQALGYGQ